MTGRALFALALCIAAPTAAQSPAPAATHVVRGVVFDSTVRAPLVGAVVHIVSRDSLGRPYTATTDSVGRYRIAGLPTGHFLIGFYHEALNVLGLDAPLRSFELAADTSVTLDIGIPSSAVVRALRCGDDSAASRDGMLAGIVRSAGKLAAVGEATIRVEWRAIVLDPGNFHTALQHATATAETDGTYQLCGLPVDAPLDLYVTAPGFRPLAGPIVVPSAGVARRDLRLVDTAEVLGAAGVRGRAVHENGKLVTTGRAVIAALARDVPVDNGTFLLANLPPGTWTVEVRAIGLEPRATLVDAADSGFTAATVTLDNRTQLLEAVTVLGKRDRNVSALEEVLRRKRSSSGTFFLPGSPALRNALHTADVLREARGFSYKSPTEIRGRVSFAGKFAGRCQSIAVYLNGAKMGIGLSGFLMLLDIAPAEVLAIEAYPDILFTPVQWRTGDACAAVVVWAKH